MVSRNRKTPIPIPSMGIRRDTEPLVMSPEALRRAENVLVHDGALRPRPAHELEPYSSVEGWAKVYDSNLPIMACAYGNEGGTYYLMFTISDGSIGYTTDLFATDPTIVKPPNDWDGGYGKAIFYADGEWVIAWEKGYVSRSGGAAAPVDYWSYWFAYTLASPKAGEDETELYDIAYDPVNGIFLTAIIDDDARSFNLYYSLDDAENWTQKSNPGGHWEPCEIGYGETSGGTELFILRVGDQDYSLYTIPTKTIVASSFTEQSTSRNGYVEFVGENNIGAILNSQTNSIVRKSTDSGATFSTVLSGGGNPEAFKLLLQGQGTTSTQITGWTGPFLTGWYFATLADEPAAIYVDGVIGTRVVGLSNLLADHDWTWIGGEIFMFCSHGDPDTAHTSPGVFTEGSYLQYLAVGQECYQSIDLDDWVEYTSAPFPPGIINAGCEADGRWWIATDEGFWLVPLTEDSAIAKPQSLTQGDVDGLPDAIVLATQQGWLYLDTLTDSWVDITAEPGGAPVQEGPLTGESRKSRTVFRFFAAGTTGEERWLLGTNGANKPKAWKEDIASGTYRDFEGSPPSYARAMCIAGNRVVLGNGPSGSVYGIDCSDALDFDGGWGELGLAWLADTEGEITSLNELGALQFVAFKTDAIYHGINQSGTGYGAPFRYELIKAGIIGPPAPHCVLQTWRGDFIYLGHDGGLYIYDGTAPQDLGKHARRIVETQVDFDNIEDSWGTLDNQRKLATFFYPTVGGKMNRGITIDLESGACWEIVLPETWDAACGKKMFITKGTTWDEVTVTWDEMNVSWDSMSTSDTRDFFVIESDVWYSRVWGNVSSYTDSGIPISVLWRNGWSLLSEADRYSTLHEMKHLMMELRSGEEFTVTAYGMDDEMVEDTGAVTGGIGSSAANEYVESDVLTVDSEGYTTEFGLTAQRFSYQIESEISKRFKWHGALARSRDRGLR